MRAWEQRNKKKMKKWEMDINKRRMKIEELRRSRGGDKRMKIMTQGTEIKGWRVRCGDKEGWT